MDISINATDKIKLNNDDFSNYIIKIIECVKKRMSSMNNLTDEIERESELRFIMINLRYVVEILVMKTKGQRPANYFINNNKDKVEWQTMNHGIHPYVELIYPIRIYIENFNSLINNILDSHDEFGIIKNSLFELNSNSFDDDVILEISEESSNKDFIVKKRMPIMDTKYHIAFECKDIDEKQPDFILYCDKYKSLPLNVVMNGELLSAAIKRQEILYNSDTYKLVEWNIEKDNVVFNNNIFKDFILSFYEEKPYHNIMTHLEQEIIFESTQKDLGLKLISIINAKTGLGIKELLYLILTLVNNSKSVMENKTESPIYYEFWNKTTKGFKLTHFEKECIFWLINNSIYKDFINSDTFNNKENYEILRNLYKTRSYESKISNEKWTKLDSSQCFNGNYTESKLYYDGENVFPLWVEKVNSAFDKMRKHKNPISLEYKKNNNHIKKFNIKKKIYENGLTIITGSAGSGKTNLIRKFILTMEESEPNNRILFISPTHKSAQIFSEIVKTTEVGTVQKWLNYSKGYFKMCSELAKFETLIIDEASMLDDLYFTNISKLINDDLFDNFKRVILIGDPEQIPPIYSVGFYKKILLEKKQYIDINIVLKKIHRQKSQGLKNYVNSFLKNKCLLNNSQPNGAKIVTYNSSSELHEILKNDSHDKILTKYNFGQYGNKIINRIIKPDLNKGNEEESYEKGDEIIIIQKEPVDNEFLRHHVHNNATLEILDTTSEEIIFKNKASSYKYNTNPNKNNQWQVKNGNIVYKYSKNFFDKKSKIPFALAKAISFHSAQGSTYKDVGVIIQPNTNYDVETMYTAISRASDSLTLYIHNDDLEKYKNELKSHYE